MPNRTITTSEAGVLGARAKWHGKTEAQRKRIMAKVRAARRRRTKGKKKDEKTH